jgi:large subunit ribosomal protein L11
VRLRVGAGAAKPGPAIGQALGPLGINMAEFCKQFNEKTKTYEKETPVPVELSAFSNRTFTFICKTPPTSWFLKRCAGVEAGAARTGHEIVGEVHVKHIYEIAKVKQTDEHLKSLSLEAISRSIVGSCRTMGLKVVTGEVSTSASGGGGGGVSESTDKGVGKKEDPKKNDTKKDAKAGAKPSGTPAGGKEGKDKAAGDAPAKDAKKNDKAPADKKK